MGQIHGSGAGNWQNATVVDSSLGSQQGRLYTNTELWSGSVGPGEIDTLTKSFVSIEHEHHEIHEGNSYVVCGSANLSSSAEYGLVMTSSGTTSAHLHSIFRTDGTSAFKIYENCSYSGGTLFTSINRNRNMIESSLYRVFEMPSITASGTLIYKYQGGNVNNNENTKRTENEFVLATGSSYLVLVKSLVANNSVSLILNWYEEVD